MSLGDALSPPIKKTPPINGTLLPDAATRRSVGYTPAPLVFSKTASATTSAQLHASAVFASIKHRERPLSPDKLERNGRYDPQMVLWLREYFMEMDTDHSETISAEELKTALQKRPPHDNGERRYFSESFFQSLIQRRGSDLRFEDILRLVFPLANERDFKVMRRLAKLVVPKSSLARQRLQNQRPETAVNARREVTTDNIEELKTIFRSLDADGNGYLSLEEFRSSTAHLGMPFRKEEVQLMFEQMDLNHDDMISIDEWVSAMRQNYMETNPLTEFTRPTRSHSDELPRHHPNFVPKQPHEPQLSR